MFLADIAPYGTVKKMRSYNGTEYKNIFFKLMVKNKIIHETAVPYSSH